MPLDHDADVSTLNGALGSNIGFCSVVGSGSDTGGAATGATLLGLATFLLDTFFARGAGLAFTFLRAGLAAFFAMVFALLDDFATFFLTAFVFATVRLRTRTALTAAIFADVADYPALRQSCQSCSRGCQKRLPGQLCAAAAPAINISVNASTVDSAARIAR